jgi:Cu2+-exporting ATPase
LAGGLALNAMAFTLPRYLGMAASFQFASLLEMVAAFSATMSLLLCGSYFIGRAWGALKAGRLHIDVPIAGGVLAAWLGSVIGWLTGSASLLYFDFVAVFIFLMLTGRRLQEVSVARNRNRLLRADPLLRSVAVFSPDAPGAPPSDRPLDALEKGTLFAVPPAGVAPVSAQLLDEEAALSLEWINGESESRVWRRGAHIPAGAVNLGQSPVRLAAREAWSDSLLHTLTNPSDAAAAADNPAARWLDRTLRVYLGVVIALALLGGLGWWLGGAAWPVALQVTISVLVVSCPCALGVAIPMSHELAVGALRRGGLFVRKPDVWGRLLRVRDIVFDKTGTLTLDAPRLRNPSLIPGLQPPERRALAHLVMESRHPLSASLREALATHKALQNGAPQPVEESPGQGLRYTDDAGTVWALRRPETQESGDAIFSRNGAALAAFSFEDAVRPVAAREIALLRRRGHEIYLLSGDREEKVLRMARDLGVPESQALARQTPEQKAEWIAAHGSHCLFVGDGANDSLAADAALVIGTPAVERCLIAEKADFYFLCRGLRPIRALFEIAACRRRAVVRAVTFALAYNAAVVALSLLGRMNPLLAAILMPLSSLATLLIVTLSLRKAG